MRRSAFLVLLLSACAAPARTVMTRPTSGPDWGTIYAVEGKRLTTCYQMNAAAHGKFHDYMGDVQCDAESRQRCLNAGVEPDCGFDGAP